jgi:hypothetical protein
VSQVPILIVARNHPDLSRYIHACYLLLHWLSVGTAHLRHLWHHRRAVTRKATLALADESWQRSQPARLCHDHLPNLEPTVMRGEYRLGVHRIDGYRRRPRWVATGG